MTPAEAYKQRIHDAMVSGNETVLDQLSEQLVYSDLAAANQREIVQKQHELDAMRAQERDRTALRDAKNRAQQENPDLFYDPQIYNDYIVPTDTQIAQEDPTLTYDERMTEAVVRVRRFLNGRTPSDLDGQAWIAGRQAEKVAQGHHAPSMRASSMSPEQQAEFNSADYAVSSEDKWRSKRIAQMRGERLAAQGRNADGTLVARDDDDDE